ncbi:MAG: hypothetical protein FGM57_02795 [Candidatus Taylorbacteria bacterium]|nr:hypothetical protein [Candidatus Taylorbacteria bacterium]
MNHMNLQEFREWFDVQFDRKIEEKISTYNTYSTSEDVHAIVTYVKQVAAHGKRFRPYLAYIALGSEKPEEHIDLFVAIEFLHLYAIIHDDIMDNGSMRHGVACAHRKFTELYFAQRVGGSLAILLGDLVFQWSYESLWSYVRTYPSTQERILGVFNELVGEVIHGQMIDVVSPTKDTYPLSLIIQKMYLKTARYSFVHPIRLGYIAKGENGDEFAESFGGALGTMFQIQDDMIDVSVQSNKSSFLDIETNQQTILSWYMRNEADAKHQDEFKTYIGRSLTDAEKANLSGIFEESGAYAYVKKEIDRYFEKAIQSARDSDVWKGIAHMVYTRTS